VSVLEVVLIVLVAALGAALVTSTTLWLLARRRATALARRLEELDRPHRRRRLVPTPSQAVRGAVGTAIMVKDHGFGGVLRSSIEDLAGWADVDGMVTILFSDIEDSTTLNHELGDRAWVQLLAKHDRIVQRAVERHGGHVVKTQGDGFMVAFGSPVDAVSAAVDVQRAMAAVRPGSRLASVRVRIGAHRGSAVHRDNDLFGRNVAVAARVASEADGGEILVSDAVLHKLDEEEFEVLKSVEVRLRGVPGTHAVHTIGRRAAGTVS
jgi:adenylate cyclase